MNARILLVNWRDTRNPEAGGAETYYHELFSRLAARGWQVDLLAHAFSGAPPEETVDGIHVMRRGSRSLFNYTAASYIRKRQHEYALVIEDLNKIPFCSRLYCSRPRLHLVMHFFGLSIFREAFFPLAAYVYVMERLFSLAYRGERFVAISGSTRDEVDRRVGHRHAGIDVVEPGIDTDFFHPTLPTQSPPMLACVSRIKKYKNLQMLIEALPLIRRVVPDVELTIAGGGDYLPTLRERVRRRGLEHAVHFLGRITEEEKRDLLSAATLFVNPSAKEGWGITTIEANMCGTVAVASDVAGLRDSLRDGDTGLLFEYGNVPQLVECVTGLLTDQDRRQAMEARAGEFARSLGWDRMTDRLEGILSSCIEDRQGSDT